MTLTWGHGCDIDKQKIVCLQNKVRTTQPITTKLDSYISLVMLSTWLDFGGILLETLFLSNFLWKFWMCFFKVKHSIGHISRMVGPNDVKRKGGALVGYWVNYVTFTFDLTHDLDLVVSRSKFEIDLFEEWGGGWGCVIDMDRKGCESIIHDHDCDLWVTMVGWVDVPYSDWGDFKRRRAFDISSFDYMRESGQFTYFTYPYYLGWFKHISAI